MKHWLYIPLLLLSGLVWAQNTPTIGNLPDSGPSLPLTCTVGQIYFKTTATVGLNQCNLLNTWTAVGGGGGGNVSTTQTNVYGAFLQDFSAATMELPEAAGFITNADSTIGIDTTTGLLHIWGLADAAQAPLASPTFTGTPTAPTQAAGDNTTDLATDAFVTTAVNNAIAGVNPAVAVQAATTQASDTSSYTYLNGVSGIGATLTGPTNNVAVVIDGFTFTVVGQRLLVKNDTQAPSGAFNGIYSLTILQGVANKPVLTRALDYDMPSDMNNTGAIPVVNGTANAQTQWVQTSQVATVGTDAVTFTQFTLNPTKIVTSPVAGTTGQPAVYTSGSAIGSLGGQVNVKAYGATGNTQTATDASITSGTNALTTTSSGKFVAGDVGKTVQIMGAGAAGVTLVTTIATFVNANSVTLTANAGTTVGPTASVFWGTDDTTAVQNALNSLTTGGTVYFPSGFYTTTGLTAVSGVSLVGEPPQVKAIANSAPDGNMIASGGSWLNCTSTNCLTGNLLRDVNLEHLGFENWTGQALLFGGNNVDGLSFARWTDLTFIGGTVTNASDTAIRVYNFQHINANAIRAYNVNTCANFLTQSQYFIAGNSEVSELYCQTYPKSAANSNATEPGIYLQVLTPASGTAQSFLYMTFIHPQVNTFSGDGTGIGIELLGISGHTVSEVNMVGVSIEGTYQYGVYLDFATANYIGVDDVLQQTGGAYTVYGTTNAFNNMTSATGQGSPTLRWLNTTFNQSSGFWASAGQLGQLGIIGDGTNNRINVQVSGLMQIAPANGSNEISANSSACESSFGISTLTATYTTGLNCLPINSIIDAVVYRITTTITGTTTSFTVGDGTIAARFCAAQSTLTSGTTGTCFVQADQTGTSGPRQTVAAKVVVTSNGTITAGAIRLIVYYHTWTPPTS